MMNYPARRDENEKPIIKALREAGATVDQLTGKGQPDLLVGFAGVTYLIEVKQEHGKSGSHSKKTDSGLRESQEKWWAAWRGAMPCVATTPAEALQAIGAVS